MKKSSLFFATPIRQQMEKTNGFAIRNHGMHEAIMLPAELLYAALGCDGFSEKRAKEIGDDAWKYFDMGHAEFHAIQEAIRAAYRMESTIKPAVGDNLLLEIQLYRKNEKQPFFDIRFAITLETGHICGAGYGSR